LEIDRRSRIEELFHEAADLPPAEQGAYLERACNGDDQLLRGIVELLASDKPETESFSVAVRQVVEQMLLKHDEDSKLIGQRIGHYVITRFIGEGERNAKPC
jgi:hypothetical protein